MGVKSSKDKSVQAWIVREVGAKDHVK